MEPIHKYFRGKWKDLEYEEKDSDSRITIKEYDIKNLDKKNVTELEELIWRQEKILNNRAFLCNLKDKGKKVQQRYSDLQTALKNANDKERLAKKKDKSQTNNVNDINYFEWGGGSSEEPLYTNNVGRTNETDVEEDEENNPLQLLARHSVEYPLKVESRHKEIDPVEDIQKDLERLEIQDEKEATRQQNDDSNYFGDRLLQVINQTHKKESFKPNRTLRKSKQTAVEQELDHPNPQGKLTPAAAEKTAQLIPLEESLKLLADAHKNESLKMKSVAAEALRTSKLVHHELPTTQNLGNYRDVNDASYHLEVEEEEVDDDIFSQSLEQEDDE